MKKISLKMLICTLIAGVLYAVIGEVMYRLLIESEILPSVVGVPLIFIGLFLFLALIIFIISKTLFTKHYEKVNMKQWAIALAVMIAGAFLLEFLYELPNPSGKKKEIDSYVFVIDRSGSMDSSDPNRTTHAAIRELLKDKDQDFEFSIYSFSNDAEMLRPMAPVSDGLDYPIQENYGGTEIRHTMKKVLADINDGTLVVNRGTRIVLLSDGYATDINVFNKSDLIKSLKKLSQKGVSVSTVGVIGADDNLMQMIADKSGGIYVKVNNVADLGDALEQATTAQRRDRDLLGYREGAFLTVLLAFMRILFITALGMVIAVEKTVLCNQFLNADLVIKSSVVQGILAGILVEIGMNAIGLPPMIMRGLMCVLLSLTLLQAESRNANASGEEASAEGFGYGGGFGSGSSF